MALSQKRVERLSDPGRYPDGSNLYLQIKPSGAKSWIFRWRRDRHEHLMGLGPAHAFSLDEAREMARDARKLLAVGKDPLQEKRRQREQDRTEAAARQTFRQLAEDFLAVHLATFKNAKHRAQWQSTLAAYAYPKLGNRDIASITDAVIGETLAPIWTKIPETAGRVKQRIERILQWEKGGRPLPTRGIKNVKHHAAMPFNQVPEFMAALAQRQGIAARALEVTILTASRTSEITGARWDEIDLESKVWTVPASRMKAGREHRVPLAGPVLTILQELPREAEYVFPGSKAKQPLSNMSLLAVLKRMNLGSFTVHGFRSSFRDWTAERTSYANIIGEAALAHTVKDKTEEAYRRGDLLDKRRPMMTAWARFCTSPRPASTVTDIGAARQAKKA